MATIAYTQPRKHHAAHHGHTPDTRRGAHPTPTRPGGAAVNIADHIYVILLAFLATLAAFTSVAILGSDGFEVLRDVLLALAGSLGGVAVAHKPTP